MDIASLRQKIDELDAELVRLLNQRAEFVVEIGRQKRATNLPIVELKREHVIYENAERCNRGPLASKDLHRIFERIIDIMRNLQRTEITSGQPEPPAIDPAIRETED
jgi:chorismate mutase